MHNNYNDKFKHALIAGGIAIIIAFFNLFLIPTLSPNGLSISELFRLIFSQTNTSVAILLSVSSLILSGVIFISLSITFFIKSFKAFLSDYFDRFANYDYFDINPKEVLILFILLIIYLIILSFVIPITFPVILILILFFFLMAN